MTDIKIPARFTDWSLPGQGPIFSRPELCDRCQHRIPDTARCTAFPDGIPIEILDNEHDHRRRFRGDNGILFLEGKPRGR